MYAAHEREDASLVDRGSAACACMRCSAPDGAHRFAAVPPVCTTCLPVLFADRWAPAFYHRSAHGRSPARQKRTKFVFPSSSILQQTTQRIKSDAGDWLGRSLRRDAADDGSAQRWSSVASMQAPSTAARARLQAGFRVAGIGLVGPVFRSRP